MVKHVKGDFANLFEEHGLNCFCSKLWFDLHFWEQLLFEPTLFRDQVVSHSGLYFDLTVSNLKYRKHFIIPKPSIADNIPFLQSFDTL